MWPGSMASMASMASMRPMGRRCGVNMDRGNAR